VTVYVKGAKGKADRLFSQMVRGRGRCEARDWPLWRPEHSCAGPLETCHIISRRYAHTRCDPDNAVCLCSSAHRYFTANPLDWAVFVEWWARDTGRWEMGPFADELRRRRDGTGKVRWEDEVTRLQSLTAGL
jgi:hypothetical protein